MISVLAMPALDPLFPPTMQAMPLAGADAVVAALACAALTGAALVVSLLALPRPTARTSRDDERGAQSSLRRAA
ncbi:MAG TPA: hypothetical protein VFD84_08330 [Candidatus Binatia bacterium]|nr:hypothetical protein [Candidatus Binatia bacterium]